MQNYAARHWVFWTCSNRLHEMHSQTWKAALDADRPVLSKPLTDPDISHHSQITSCSRIADKLV